MQIHYEILLYNAIQIPFWNTKYIAVHLRVFQKKKLSARPWNGRVKIYNVKIVKTEMATGTPKLCLK